MAYEAVSPLRRRMIEDNDDPQIRADIGFRSLIDCRSDKNVSTRTASCSLYISVAVLITRVSSV
jgi:hypothetical protein